MRTTLNLDDDVFQAVRSYAGSRSLSLSEAVCELVRKRLRPPMRNANAE
jgi:Arc/MetJ family transcription regulator